VALVAVLVQLAAGLLDLGGGQLEAGLAFGEAGQGGVGAPVEHRPSDVGLDVDQPVRVGVEADQGAGLRQVGLDDPADVDGVGGVPVVLQARALAGGAVDAAAAAGQGDPGDAGDDQDG